MTTVLLVSPGPNFSTFDVFTGVRAGLQANGVNVVEWRLDVQLEFFGMLIDTAIDHDVLTTPVDPFVLAMRGVTEIAVAHEVDAVLFISGSNVPWGYPLTLRQLAAQRKKPFPVAVYLTESPYFPEDTFAHLYDVVLTNERLSVPGFNHPRVYYLPHAYNPQVHTPGPPDTDCQCDVFFVGSGFDERKALFDGVNWDGIQFVKQGILWDDTGRPDLLTPGDTTDNAEVVRWYRSAAINLNHHRTTTLYGSGEHIAPSMAASLGPRAYEIAACGGFQICDDSRPELFDIFGDTIPTYKAGDSAHLERLIRAYIAKPDTRAQLARAQHEAIRPHSWTVRAAHLLALLNI